MVGREKLLRKQSSLKPLTAAHMWSCCNKSFLKVKKPKIKLDCPLGVGYSIGHKCFSLNSHVGLDFLKDSFYIKYLDG